MELKLSKVALASLRELVNSPNGFEVIAHLRTACPISKIGAPDDSNLIEYAALTGAESRGWVKCVDYIENLAALKVAESE